MVLPASRLALFASLGSRERLFGHWINSIDNEKTGQLYVYGAGSSYFCLVRPLQLHMHRTCYSGAGGLVSCIIIIGHTLEVQTSPTNAWIMMN